MTNRYDGAGNLYNKYESKNPVVKLLMGKFFSDLNKIILPVKDEIVSAYDIGCGEGYITEYFSQMGIPIEGSDISSRIVEIARKNHPSIIFSLRSIYDLSIIEKQFDLIIANEVFEHLSNPDIAIEQLKKISKKYILITVPNEPLFRMANILSLKYLKDAGNTPGHINHWSKKGVELFLTSHKLIIKTTKCSTLWTMVLCKKP